MLLRQRELERIQGFPGVRVSELAYKCGVAKVKHTTLTIGKDPGFT